jgi:hypothetical protein
MTTLKTHEIQCLEIIAEADGAYAADIYENMKLSNRTYHVPVKIVVFDWLRNAYVAGYIDVDNDLECYYIKKSGLLFLRNRSMQEAPASKEPNWDDDDFDLVE